MPTLRAQRSRPPERAARCIRADGSHGWPRRPDECQRAADLTDRLRVARDDERYRSSPVEIHQLPTNDNIKAQCNILSHHFSCLIVSGKHTSTFKELKAAEIALFIGTMAIERPH